MKAVAIIILVFAIIMPIYFLDLTHNWRELIWRTGGKVFRLVKDNEHYFVEKRFLWFFYIRRKKNGLLKVFWSREDAIKYIQDFLQELEDAEKAYSEEIIDFSNQITDSKRLLESKELETKRIKIKQ